jgi:hypothetical protein
MGTDFFDDDLAHGESQAGAEAERKPAVEKSAESAGRLVRHREDLAAKVSDSAGKLDQLRRRQEELEREKAGLESESRKQEEYERGKRDIIEKLDRSIILVEKEEIQAAQMAEILSATRQRFRDTLAEVRGINEEQWPPESVPEELNKALALVEDAREVFKKGMAKIEASRWQDAGGRKAEAMTYDSDAGDLGSKLGFGLLLKVGLAVTLPIVVVLVGLFVAYLVMSR